MVTKYKTLAELVLALKDGAIPVDVVSPGRAAQLMGVTRQAINYFIGIGSLDVWRAEGVILIGVESVTKLQRKRMDIPDSQQDFSFE